MSSPHTGRNTAHSVADLSAVHRNLLWMLAQTGTCERRQLQRALSTYYTDNVDHSQIYNALEELIERGYVNTDDTITYQLTESARRALSARQAWQAVTLTTSDGESK